MNENPYRFDLLIKVDFLKRISDSQYLLDRLSVN